MEGFGILIKQNEKYEGNFVKSKYHGNGKLTLSDGTFYEGEFKNNMRSGYGVLTY